MAEQPLVSIVTPAFNAMRLLPETMAAVRSQTHANYEHIVVDDCSTDATYDWLTALAQEDPRIKPVLLGRNSGPIVARNAGISRARGRYLAFLDADDLWLPRKLELQVALMERSGAALSFTDYRHMSYDGARVGRVIAGPREISLAAHYRTRYFCCSSVMVNRERAPTFAFPPIAPAVRAEDFIAWANLMRAHGAAQRCAHDLVRYRLVPRSRSAAKVRAARSVWHLYRTVEKLSWASAAWNFTCFAITATAKHLWAWPRLQRQRVDGGG